jgi:hypothetical protein
MRNSGIDKKKILASIKLNGRQISDEISDVSEEGSVEPTEENEE